MAAIMAGGVLAAGAVPGAYAAGSAAAAPQLTAARPIPGLNALNAGGTARVTSVSCGTAGNCAAVGSFTDASGNLLPFVADEKNGTWGNARELALETRATNVKAELLSVSCASAADCSAVGYSGADGLPVAITVSETSGTWGPVQVIPGINGQESEAGSVSCPAAGTCAADGFVVTGGAVEPFTVAQANGTWGTAAVVPGVAALNVGKNAGATNISCAAPGSCAAAGLYSDVNDDLPSWVASTAGNGSWNPALPEPGTSGGGLREIGAPPQITVSCGAPGNCAAAGWTDTNATRTRTSFVLNEVNSAWGAPRDVPGLAALTGTGGFSRITAVSCKSAGNCTVTGQFSTSLRGTRAFAVSEVNGTWGNALEIPGIAALGGGTDAASASAVSCATAGNCAAGGVYDDSTPAEHVFVAVQAGGAWGNAQQLTGTGTRPTLSSASCATPGNCAFGGFGTDASGHLQGFVADLSAGAGAGAPGQIQTTTSVALSAATVTFGREQAGQIAVTVSAASGGAPRGVVTVTANKATVCLIVLGSGTGSCRLTPKGLRPGTYALTARFFGGLGFAGSASAPATLTVTR